MKIERAIEILDPEHREQYESLKPVNEACRMGMEALRRLEPRPPHPDGDEHLLACPHCGRRVPAQRGRERAAVLRPVRTGD